MKTSRKLVIQCIVAPCRLGGYQLLFGSTEGNGIRAQSIVVVTARRAGIYYENYSHTHNRVPHPVCVEPSSMMNNSTQCYENKAAVYTMVGA